jgi:hypothetical protein
MPSFSGLAVIIDSVPLVAEHATARIPIPKNKKKDDNMFLPSKRSLSCP